MSAEDRLRDILSSEARTVQPAGDGLARIQARVARRRRLRVLLVPAGALATAGAVVAVMVLGGAGDQSLEQLPPATQAPTPTPTPVHTTPIPVYDGPAIWPFTSAQQAQDAKANPSARPWASDPVAVAGRFASEFLGLTGLSGQGDGQRVQLQLAGRPVGTVQLRQLVADGPWTVVGVDGGDLTVTAPAAGAAIVSPTQVTGRITGMHENVRLQLVSTAGKELAQTGAPAGQEAPWQGTLSWSDSSWSTAGIIGTTRSDRDGSLTRLVAVPVTRAPSTSPPAAPPASFVSPVDGKVLLFDAADGRRLRQLTYPPAGSIDTAATWAGSTLAWVRHKSSGCGDALYLKTGDQISTVVQPGAYALSSLQLSLDAGQLAWVQAPCGGGASSLVVSQDGQPGRVVSLPAETDSRVLDVETTGTVLLLTEPGEGTGPPVLRRVATEDGQLSEAQTLRNADAEGSPATSCTWSAAAFEGAGVLAAESCRDSTRMVHLSLEGERVSADPVLLSNTIVSVISIRGESVLVEFSDPYSESPPSIGTYRPGHLMAFPALDSCKPEVGGCRGDPDW